MNLCLATSFKLFILVIFIYFALITKNDLKFYLPNNIDVLKIDEPP